MSMFIRCNWEAPEGASVDVRLAQSAHLLQRLTTIPWIGKDWFRLGRSRGESLSRQVAWKDIAERSAWRKVKLSAREAYFSLDAWNGKDEHESLNLSIQIHEPPVELDQVLLSGIWPTAMRAAHVRWVNVLEVAEQLTLELAGRSIVGSNELLKLAREHGWRHAESSAHAVYWVHKKDIAKARGLELTLPIDVKGRLRSVVASKSWDHAISPSQDAIESLAGFLDRPE